MMFIWLGAKGLINCITYSHARIFLLCYVGYLAVGLGSIAFHTTLKCKFNKWYGFPYYLTDRDFLYLDPMQLVDELSMVYST
jgi:dihydroceramidase